MKPIPLLPALIWLLVILALISWPEKQIPDADILNIPYMDKAIHFFLFAVLAVFVYGGLLLQDKDSYLHVNSLFITIVIGLTYGAITEIIQYFFIVGRYGTMGDFLANAFGTVFGVFVIRKSGKEYLFGHAV